jgi:catechol 2,3-dioxygenase-like lactoylglutathione lyase family enzyme
MIKLRHIGIVVRDLEKSKKFYETVFKLIPVKQIVEEGEFIERLVGIENASIHWVKLSAKDGTIIELLEYKNNPFTQIDNYPANRLGCSHIAVSVEDIEATYQKLLLLGCKTNSKPLFSPDGKVKVMYAHDLDGTIIEVVQEL